MQVLIPRRHLAAALHTAGVTDIRYYLNGVFVEILDEEIRVVGVNGATLSVFRHSIEPGSAAVCSAIIPRSAVELAIKDKSVMLALNLDGANSRLGSIVFSPVEGRFPEYRRVIPATVSGEAAQFDPQFTAAFSKIAKSLGSRSNPVIRHNGEGSAIVQILGCEGFIGVMMPWRFTPACPDPGMPTWGRA